MFPRIYFSRRWWVAVFFTLLLMFIFPQSALADGIIIPDPPPEPDPLTWEESWLAIRYHRVEVEIVDQVAVTRVDQVFENEGQVTLEGQYVFPLPEGAAVSQFTMWVDGKPRNAEVLSAEEAQSIYLDILRRERDPALLEYVGRGAVRARVYPIPPGGSRRISLEYTQVLSLEGGLIHYSYPLNTEKFSTRPLEECTVQVRIRSERPLRTLYSPTHQDRVVVRRTGEHRAEVGYEELDVLPVEDFELVLSVGEDPVDLRFLSTPGSLDGGGEGGYFMMLVSPEMDVDRVIPRDILVVLDTSGSMEGVKLSQAQRAVNYVLNHLNPGDRFNVIAFASGVRVFHSDLQSREKAGDAADWVQGLEAVGGTDIHRALLEALHFSRESAAGGTKDRPVVILFLTDGQPTEGITEIDEIIARVDSSASDRVRIFPFGVGDDVNTLLLDSLAEKNRGAVGYVRPGEDIQEKVSALYSRVQMPVLTDLHLETVGIGIEDVYPGRLPDLFAGSQLMLTGRYRLRKDGASPVITLRGSVEGEVRNYRYPISVDPGKLPAGFDPAFIPRLWAQRKVGHYLTQIRLYGEKEEWVQAVIHLSVRYGILTPYTSFLIQDGEVLSREGQEEAAREVAAQSESPAVGAEAVDKAQAEAELRSSNAASRPGSGMKSPGPGWTSQRVRVVGERAFYLQEGVWTDSAYQPGEFPVETIPLGSERYLQLLSDHPEWGSYLALGREVKFVVDDQVYHVQDSETLSLSPAPDQESDRFSDRDLINPGGLISRFLKVIFPGVFD